MGSGGGFGEHVGRFPREPQEGRSKDLEKCVRGPGSPEMGLVVDGNELTEGERTV